MNSIRKLLAVSVIAGTLVACGGTTYIGGFGDADHLMFRDGLLTSHVSGRPDAVINAAGDLTIDGKPVATTSTQRGLLKAYYGEVVNIRHAGIETGKAGATMAAHAIGAVASGLAHGDPDGIGPKIDAHAKDIETQALAICENLQSLQKTQDELNASLPAFKPYGTVEVREDTDCRMHASHTTKT